MTRREDISRAIRLLNYRYLNLLNYEQNKVSISNLVSIHDIIYSQLVNR